MFTGCAEQSQAQGENALRNGIDQWRKYLKPGGYITVSDASWLTPERPAEIEVFWRDTYPEIDTVSAKVAQMEKAGYVPVASFVLPETCWTDQFYDPQVSAQKKFLEKYAGNKTAEDLIENQRHEAALYETYKAFYGYAFYIGKKI